MDGVGALRDLDPAAGQLSPKSYCPRTGRQGRLLESPQAQDQLRRRRDRRLPYPPAVSGVKRREHLASARVDDREARPCSRLRADGPRERVERAHADHGDAERCPQPSSGRKADPQAGERPRPDTRREQGDRVPAAACGDPALDLDQQRRRVLRALSRRGSDESLVDDLATAQGADRRVVGGGVESDRRRRIGLRRQRGRRKNQVPTRLPFTNQVTLWRPGPESRIGFR